MIRAVDIDGNYYDVARSDISWRPSVYGIIIENGKILLSPQHGENRYDLPGGGVDMDEHVEDALRREVKEETGIDIEASKLLAVRDNFFKVTFIEPQETWHSIMLYYLCEKIGGEITNEGFSGSEAEYAATAVWLPLEELDIIEPAASYDWREIINEHILDSTDIL